MTVYCAGNLRFEYDGDGNSNHTILFTVDHEDGVETHKQIIAEHYTKTISDDLATRQGNTLKISNCRFTTDFITSKEVYGTLKKFTFEYTGNE